MSARIALVVAIAENGVIGAAGGMPWRLSSDLREFRRLTMGKPVVMGRKTFESIGKPLDGRDNVVVSRDPAFAPQGVTVAPSIAVAMAAAERFAAARGVDEVAVIGGGHVYAATIDLADRLYVTEVHAAPEGDTIFPAIDPATWREVARAHGERTARDSTDFSFVVYERIGRNRHAGI